MRILFAVSLVLALTGFSSVQAADARVSVNEQSIPFASVLHKKKWIHGAIDCESNVDPAIEVFRYDHSSYVLRQNKCLSFEAPFIYVLFGEAKVLVLDTGATESELDFPLYETVKSLIREQAQQEDTIEKTLLVIHSHGHADHIAGDSQFEGKPNVIVVEPTSAAVHQFFGLKEWPDDAAHVDLGARKLTVIPTPGHQEEAITVYDPQTKWLLTGDTLYPGYIYVKNWDAYKKSVARLVSFSKTVEISSILGAHIEKAEKAGEYYAVGTVYQPNEAGLALAAEDLVALNSVLKKYDKPREIEFDNFVLIPLSTFQKIISSVARWIFQ